MNRVLQAILAVVFTVTAFAWQAAAAESHAVVFMYHRFGEDNFRSTNIKLEQFDAHLDYLAENGFTVWPLERIVEQIRAGEPIPDRTVAITIDDAYRSIYTEAYPRLKERGWPFTVFVATDPVDRGFKSFLTWDEMREMAKGGATFANHGRTHAHLADRVAGETAEEWRERVKAEISWAEKRLTEEFGNSPRIFAYPYGEYNRELGILISELGYVAFGQHSGAIGEYSDMRALPRYPMAEAYADMDGFAMKAMSLPLPVRSVRPWDPVVTGDRRPKLEVELAESNASLGTLGCYVSNQGRVDVQWIDKKAGRFTVQPPEPLSVGRSRYNCTALTRKGDRYYWYSHSWLVRNDLRGARGRGPDR
jgi:peptidoglycan/xylan/chitin deacetylase (PgdA/CDA1 family)